MPLQIHRVLTTAIAVSTLAVTVHAEILTPAELLQSPEKWTLQGDWSIEDGLLTQTNTQGQQHAFYRGVAFADVTMETSFRVEEQGNGSRAAGMILRSSDAESAIFVQFGTRHNQVILFRRNMWLPDSEIARKQGVPIESGKWHQARVDVKGAMITVSLDGKVVVTAEDATNEAGLCGFYTSQGAVEFKDAKITGVPCKLAKPWKEKKAGSHTCDVPRDQAIAEILDVRVLARDRYVGWPSVACGKDGELMAVYSGDRDGHVCEKGKVRLIRSTDGGKTWTKPETVIDLPIDDRDSGIIQTKTGAWLGLLVHGTSLFHGIAGRLCHPVDRRRKDLVEADQHPRQRPARADPTERRAAALHRSAPPLLACEAAQLQRSAQGFALSGVPSPNRPMTA